MHIEELLRNPVVAVRKDLLRKRFQNNFVEQVEEARAMPLPDCRDTYTVIVPEHTEHNELVVLIGGFSQGIQAYADELYDLYQAGYVTVYVNPARGYEGDLSKLHVQFKKTYTVPDVVVRKVLAIEVLLQQLDSEHYHLVGHSQGGMLGAHVAALHATHVKSLTMVNPEGFQKDQTATEIAAKFAYQAVDQATDILEQTFQGETNLLEPTGRASRTFMRNFLNDTLWRLTDEVPAGISVDLATLLLHLKTTHVHTTLLVGHSDRLFTTKEYESYLLKDYGHGRSWNSLIDSYMSFIRKGAGHTALGIEKAGVLRQIIEADNSD